MALNETLKDVGLKVQQTTFLTSFDNEHRILLLKFLSVADANELAQQYLSIQRRMKKFDAKLADCVIKQLEKRA